MIDQKVPPKASEKKSLDFNLSLSFHAGMMVLICSHFFLGVGIKGEIGFASCLAFVMVILSVRNRRKLGWHWPGVKLKDVLGAMGVAILIVFFLGASLPGNSVLNPRLFPWLAAGANLLVYGVLRTLKVVNESNNDFLRNCGQGQPIAPSELTPTPLDPQLTSWKRVVSISFQIYFFLVWIAGVSFFWKFNSAYAHGSPQPTATQTEKLNNHGHWVYITEKEKNMVALLEYSLKIGVPSVFVIGAILHFGVGVKVFGTKSARRQN